MYQLRLFTEIILSRLNQVHPLCMLAHAAMLWYFQLQNLHNIQLANLAKDNDEQIVVMVLSFVKYMAEKD